jgi:proline iminopeptidase
MTRNAILRTAPKRGIGRSGMVNVNGVRIYCKIVGRGPPLIALHGGPGADHSDFLPHLLPLARRNRLILIDERGSGRSQRLDEPAAYTLANMVADVEGVRRALRLGRISLLGHSFGGILAQAYAIRYPGVVRRLILAGTAPSAALIDRDFRRIRRRLPRPVRARMLAYERRGIFRGDGRYRMGYARLTQRILDPYMYARNPPREAAAQALSGWEVLREMWVRRSDFRIDGNLRGFDMTQGLRKVSARTLVVVGVRDIVSRSSARALAQALPNSTLVVMADCAHMMFVDQTRAFNSLVAKFLMDQELARIPEHAAQVVKIEPRTTSRASTRARGRPRDARG